MTDYCRHRGASRERGDRPDLCIFFITQIQRLPWPVADWIIAPWGQAVLTAVHCPGTAQSRLRHEKAEIWIGDYIDPRARRQLTRFQIDHILLPIRAKATQPVVKVKVCRACQRRRRLCSFAPAEERVEFWQASERLIHA